jgi:hypothetical protein
MMSTISRGKTLALAVCLAFAGIVSTAAALDFNDVKNLIGNQVAETVIQNMVGQDSSLVITDSQANELRSLGASETLVASIRRAPAAAAVTVVPQVVSDKPQTFTSTDGVTYQLNPATGNYYRVSPQVVVQPAPTVVYQTPRVYTTPTYVYPSAPIYRPRPSWNFSFHFGGGPRWGGPRWGHGRPHRW